MKINRQHPRNGLGRLIFFLLGCILAVCTATPIDAAPDTVSLDNSLEALGFITLSNDPDAPDFTLQDASGKSIRLADQRGKVVFLTFWTTW